MTQDKQPTKMIRIGKNSTALLFNPITFRERWMLEAIIKNKFEEGKRKAFERREWVEVYNALICLRMFLRDGQPTEWDKSRMNKIDKIVAKVNQYLICVPRTR